MDRDFEQNGWERFRRGNQGSHKSLSVLPPAVKDLTVGATNMKRKPAIGSMEFQCQN
jgi:hypothetical protein